MSVRPMGKKGGGVPIGGKRGGAKGGPPPPPQQQQQGPPPPKPVQPEEEETEEECLICTEPLDEFDVSFQPCPCKFTICVWCWHKIREECPPIEKPRCPGCRAEYNEAAILNTKLVPVPRKPKPKTSFAAIARGNKEPVKEAPKRPGRPELLRCRIRQRNVICVVGLSKNIASEERLRSNAFFGQYGAVQKLTVNQPTGLGTATAQVVYATPEQAQRAVRCVDGCWCDGRQLRAVFGTTKYCPSFVREVPCGNPQCPFLHTLASKEDQWERKDVLSQPSEPLGPRIRFPLSHKERQQLPSVDEVDRLERGEPLDPPEEPAPETSAPVAGERKGSESWAERVSRLNKPSAGGKAPPAKNDEGGRQQTGTTNQVGKVSIDTSARQSKRSFVFKAPDSPPTSPAEPVEETAGAETPPATATVDDVVELEREGRAKVWDERDRAFKMILKEWIIIITKAMEEPIEPLPEPPKAKEPEKKPEAHTRNTDSVTAAAAAAATATTATTTTMFPPQLPPHGNTVFQPKQETADLSAPPAPSIDAVVGSRLALYARAAEDASPSPPPAPTTATSSSPTPMPPPASTASPAPIPVLPTMLPQPGIPLPGIGGGLIGGWNAFYGIPPAGQFQPGQPQQQQQQQQQQQPQLQPQQQQQQDEAVQRLLAMCKQPQPALPFPVLPTINPAAQLWPGTSFKIPTSSPQS